MSDRFAGQLRIGGKLNDAQAEALIGALSEAGSLEYGEAEFEPTTKQEILDALDDSGHLVIRNAQTRNGEFEEAEEILTEAGIAWERWSTGYAEYEAALAWWQPGMKDTGWSACDEGGNQICPMEPATEALELLEYADSLDQMKVHTRALMIKKAIEWLKKVVVKIPELPKMEFV